MNYFTEITGGQAIVHSRGVFRQVPIYARGDRVYAKYGGGYVRLSCSGSTSSPNVRWSEYDAGAANITESGLNEPTYHGQPEKLEAAE